MWVQQVGCGVQAITFARDGRTLYTVDTNSRLLAWDATTRARRDVAVGSGAEFVSTNHIFELPNGWLLVDALHGFQFVNLRTGACSSGEPPNRKRGAQFNTLLPDGRAFFIHPNGRVIGSTDLLTRKELPSLEIPDLEPNRGLTSLTVAPDGRSAFISTQTSSGRILFNITPAHQLVKREPYTAVSLFQTPRFAPDGRTVVLLGVYETALTVWDVERREARGKPVWWAGGEVRIAFNPVLPLFAVPHTQNTVAVRSLETGELVRELDFALGKQITALAFAPDGLTCAVGGTNKRFAVFDVDV